MARQGRASERIVEAIENVLVREFNAEVLSPGFLEDTKTGEQREIDVLLTCKVAHHSYRTCIEVRDRKKKVGSPDVEAFVTKTNDVLADRRVIVSTSGFTAPALKKAAAYNVQCFDLTTTEGHPWCLAPGLVERRREASSGHLRVAPMSSKAFEADRSTDSPGAALPVQLVNSSGEPATLDSILGGAWQAFQQQAPWPERDGEFVSSIILRISEDAPVFLVGAKQRHEVASMTATFRYRVSRTLRPFAAVSYQDRSAGLVADAVISEPVEAFGRELRLVISDDGAGPQASIVATPKED